MNLSEFSKLLTSNDVYNAKNSLNYLIGNSPYSENAGKAIYAFYLSLDDNLRAEKKILTPFAYNYFVKYLITENNYPLFLEFKDFLKPAQIQIIKNKNINWNFDTSEFNIKNIRELIKYCRVINIEDNLAKFFLREHENIKKILNKNKKYAQEVIFDGLFLNIAINSFSDFLNICKKYEINEQEWLIKLINKNGFDSYSFNNLLKDKNINSLGPLLTEILNKEEVITAKEKFITFCSPHIRYGTYQAKTPHDLLFLLFCNKQLETVKFMINNWNNLLNQSLKHKIGYNKLDLKENFKLMFEQDLRQDNLNYEKKNLIDKNKLDFFTFLNKIELENKLIKNISSENINLVKNKNKI